MTMKNKRLFIIGLIVVVILFIPLLAMQFTEEVNWDLPDFVVAGVLLFGTGLLLEVVLRKAKKSKYLIAIIKGYNEEDNIITSESYSKMLKENIINNTGVFWSVKELDNSNYIGHGGFDPGIQTQIFFDKRNGVGYLFFTTTNTFTGPRSDSRPLPCPTAPPAKCLCRGWAPTGSSLHPQSHRISQSRHLWASGQRDRTCSLPKPVFDAFCRSLRCCSRSGAASRLP